MQARGFFCVLLQRFQKWKLLALVLACFQSFLLLNVFVDAGMLLSIALAPVCPSVERRLQRRQGSAVHNGAMNRFSVPVLALCLGGVLCLTACAPYAGITVPVGPLRVGVGLGSGGVSAGVGTGIGPVGVGIGVQPNGQINGHAGVGASVPIGAASVGAGIGGSTVLHSPASTQAAPPASAIAPHPAQPRQATQWRDAQGRIVPQCRVMGGC